MHLMGGLRHEGMELALWWLRDELACSLGKLQFGSSARKFGNPLTRHGSQAKSQKADNILHYSSYL